jgi:SAM-dependent methyltransferase
VRSEEWDARFAATEFAFTDRPNRTVADETGGLTPGTAVELGAGQGRNAVWLAERGWTVTAVDFSPVGLAAAERLAADRGVDLTLVRADVRAWEIPGLFDLVLIAYVQLPSDELRGVLARAAAAVAMGGTMLVVGHDERNLTDGFGGPRSPDVLYSPERIAGALGDLRIERAERIDRVVDTEDGPRVAIDTLVRACREQGSFAAEEG